MPHDQGRDSRRFSELSLSPPTGHSETTDDLRTGERLDKALAAARPELSRTQWKELIDRGGVLVDGRRVVKSHILIAGETIAVDEDAVAGLLAPELAVWTGAFDPASPSPDNQAMGMPTKPPGTGDRFVLLAETSDYIAISKPAGIPTHPHDAAENHTALNAFLALDPTIAQAGPRPLEGGLLHRLDNDTSGLLLAARTPAAFETLSAQLRDSAAKFYLAFVRGDLAAETRVGFPIAHHAKKADRMVAIPAPPALPHALAAGPHRGTPRAAESRFFPLARFGDCSFVLVVVGSAQMHQVRVHAAALGMPLLADGVYGKTVTAGHESGTRRHADEEPPLFERHALHAWRILAPGLELEAPLPSDFRAALRKKGIEDAEILLARARKLDYS